jgi:hypothetical protein
MKRLVNTSAVVLAGGGFVALVSGIAAQAETVPTIAAQTHRSWRLSPKGFGPIHAGMTKSEFSKATDIIEDPYPLPNCLQVELKAYPDVHVMVVDNLVTRITVRNPNLKTDRGIGIGSTEKSVLAAYSGIEIKPHQYTSPPAHYLTYWTVPNREGIRFETDINGLVDTIHVGNNDIELVEGCA